MATLTNGSYDLRLSHVKTAVEPLLAIITSPAMRAETRPSFAFMMEVFRVSGLLRQAIKMVSPIAHSLTHPIRVSADASRYCCGLGGPAIELDLSAALTSLLELNPRG